MISRIKIETVLAVIMVLSCTTLVKSQSWIQRSNLPGNPVTATSGCSFNGKGYVAFGLTGSPSNIINNNNNLFEYDPIMNNWLQKNNFPGVIRRSGVFVSNDSVVFAGLGSNGSTNFSDFYQYFPQSDSWSSRASYPGNGGHLAIAEITSNYVYVGGGLNQQTNAHQSDFWRYDILNNTWDNNIAAFPFGSRTGAISFLNNNKIYVGLGHNGSRSFNDLWEYDIALDQWTRKANFPGTDRLNASCLMIQGKAIVGGGYKLSTAGGLSDYYEYDPITDTWSTLPTFTEGNRSLCAEFVINNIGYLTGGWDGQKNDISSTWSFKPLLTTSEYHQTTSSLSNFIIFPIPSSKSITLKFTNTYNEATINIIDIKGKIVHTEQLNGFEVNKVINIEQIPSGNYVYRITTRSGSINGKLPIIK